MPFANYPNTFIDNKPYQIFEFNKNVWLIHFPADLLLRNKLNGILGLRKRISAIKK